MWRHWHILGKKPVKCGIKNEQDNIHGEATVFFTALRDHRINHNRNENWQFGLRGKILCKKFSLYQRKLSTRSWTCLIDVWTVLNFTRTRLKDATKPLLNHSRVSTAILPQLRTKLNTHLFFPSSYSSGKAPFIKCTTTNVCNSHTFTSPGNLQHTRDSVNSNKINKSCLYGFSLKVFELQIVNWIHCAR